MAGGGVEGERGEGLAKLVSDLKDVNDFLLKVFDWKK